MYNVKIIICGISVNFVKDEKYVVSLSPDKIIFPTFIPTDLTNMPQKVASCITAIFTDEPSVYHYANRARFININDENVSALFPETINDTIYLTYGITLPNADLKENLYWCPFEFLDTTIIKELSIIGSAIDHAI